MKKFLLSVVAGMGLTTATMSQTVPSYVPTNGLLGYWGFDGNAQDYSGNGKHGTVNGATLTLDRNGVANKAYNFDGINDYISANPNLPIGASPRTVSSWFNTITGTIATSQYPNLQCVTGWGDPFSGKVIFPQFIIAPSGKAYFESGSSGDQTFSKNSLNNGTWHNYVTTYGGAGSRVKIYIDGIIQDSSAVINLNTSNSFFGIGSAPWANVPFKGQIDDIGIWNRALTQQEITALYNICNLNPTIIPTTSNLNLGNDASFQATSGGSNINFQWQTNSNNLGWQNVPNNLSYLGANTASLTVKNVQLGNHLQPFRVIATSGNCTDTSDVASIHVGDTCLITVHDTLVINRTITGLSAPNNKNTIKVYPNPAKDHVIIHYGNFAMMNGYSVKITNTLGQELFAAPINQQTSSVNLSNWINHSLYFIQIIDPQGKTVETRKILIE